MKIARSYTKRPAIISFEDGFHGRTYMAMALTSKTHPYKAGFQPFVSDVYRVQYAYCYRCSFGQDPATCELDCARHLENVFKRVVGGRKRSSHHCRAGAGGGRRIHCAASCVLSHPRRDMPQARNSVPLPMRCRPESAALARCLHASNMASSQTCCCLGEVAGRRTAHFCDQGTAPKSWTPQKSADLAERSSEMQYRARGGGSLYSTWLSAKS